MLFFLIINLKGINTALHGWDALSPSEPYQGAGGAPGVHATAHGGKGGVSRGRNKSQENCELTEHRKEQLPLCITCTITNTFS